MTYPNKKVFIFILFFYVILFGYLDNLFYIAPTLKQYTMNQITFSEETLNQLIKDTRLEMSLVKTELEREYYRGSLAVYKTMLMMLKE